MKDQNQVIEEFNAIVNMTAPELDKWLKTDDSQSAGWPKGDDGQADGESVGHESGRRIIEILRSNSNKDPEKYTEEQIEHMRKVVSYCKRHLGQEEKSNSKKSAEEVKKTKSYASLKNWGHDPLKKRGEDKNGSAADKEEEDDEEEGVEEEEEEEEEEEVEEEEEEEETGDKRKKKTTKEQSPPNKARKTRSGAHTSGDKNSKADRPDNEDEQDEQDEDEEEGADEEEEDHGDKAKEKNGNGKKRENNDKKKEKKTNGSQEAKNGPSTGDTVSWAWGSGHPKGKVLDVKPEKTSITTKRGNQVSRDGKPEDPAVVLDAGKSKAIKLDHELD